MVDWTSTMQQTYEFYIVDPSSWKDTELIPNVKSCTINRDSEAETLGSASLNMTESIGECYVRIYLITIQNGVKEKDPLGTYLVQTPSSSYDGRIKDLTMDAYTPLLELKEKQPPLGFTLEKKTNEAIMTAAHRLTQEYSRAPVVPAKSTTKLATNFTANTDDTWLTFISDLASSDKYKLDLDEMGRILFSPVQEIEALQPVCTFDDGNSSILYPDVNVEHDIYGIPNVVEVTYVSGNAVYYSKAVNDDENSPTSTVSRGREITYRVDSPNLAGVTEQSQVDAYAKQVLKDLSTIEYKITYTHGYRPLRLGDCVRLNYVRAGFKDIKAKIVSQSIECRPGCPVTEKAIFTKKLWG